MSKLVRPIAITLMGLGLVLVTIGAVTMSKANEGLDSLQAVYGAQNVTLSYNDDGELIDRGETEPAQAILALLEDDWKYPVNHADLDPADPLVNTPTELMYQYAVISYHILHGTHTVTLEEDVPYNGEVFAAGTYEVDVDGRYWTDFDRLHPLDGQVRDLAWSGTAHGLLGSIAAGVNADYQAGFAHFSGWRTILFGFAIGIGGFGLLALSVPRKQAKADERSEELARELATIA
jgi:hypothetical protein